MDYSSLVSHTQKFGVRRSGLLIIMPAYANLENVKRHLLLLARQTYQGFNVLVVAGVPLDEKALGAFIAQKKFRFGVIVGKENEQRGCSGAFFAGQKYALENGYEYIIMTDDDCMPAHRNVVRALYEKRHVGYVASTRHLVQGADKKVIRDFGVAQYCLLSCALLKKHGLYFLPLYNGADDGEYAERLSGEKKARVDEFVEHPYIAGQRLFSMYDRSWHFFLQSLIIMKSPRSLFYNLLSLGFLMGASILFLPPYGARTAYFMAQLLLSFTYGKAAAKRMKSGYQSFLARSPPANFTKWNGGKGGYIASGQASKAAGAASSFAAAFRRDIVVEKSDSFVKCHAIGMAARKSYVKTDGGYLLLSDNSNALLHAIRLALFLPISLLYCIAIGALFVPIKILRQPKTEGYGL